MSSNIPKEEFIHQFIDSMPEDYAQTFNDEEKSIHAGIAFERGDAVANAGLFPSWGDDAAALCVVAQDQPGLLSLISAALVINGLDVVDAEAYTRRLPEGGAEAVDLFFVRRAPPADDEPLDHQVVSRFVTTLRNLISGDLDSQVALRATPPPEGRAETNVRFLENVQGALSGIEVETTDRFGLLLALTRALYDKRLKIVRSEVHTKKGRVVDRFFVLEFDDSAISDTRRLEIQIAVISALEKVV